MMIQIGLCDDLYGNIQFADQFYEPLKEDQFDIQVL